MRDKIGRVSDFNGSDSIIVNKQAIRNVKNSLKHLYNFKGGKFSCRHAFYT